MAIADVRRRRRDPNGMTLAGHLAELRRRLLICIAAIAVLGVVAWAFYGPLLNFLLHPYCSAFPKAAIPGGKSCQLYIQDPLQGLSFRFQVSLFGGVVLASPIVLWELWRFVTPGLKRNEKRYAVPFITTSIVLFVLGSALAYWSFEHALVFLRSIGGSKLTPIYSPTEYASLLLLVMFLYGLAFIFPVLLVSLELAGILSSRTLFKHWRIAVFGLFLLSAVFTPTGDPVSMLFLAIPLSLFYLGAAYVGRLLGK